MTDTVGIVAAVYVMLTSIVHFVVTRNEDQVDVKRFRIVLITAIVMALLYLVK